LTSCETGAGFAAVCAKTGADVIASTQASALAMGRYDFIVRESPEDRV